VNRTVSTLFDQHPAVAIRHHPRLRTTLWRLQRSGELQSPLPGVLVLATDNRPLTSLAAISLWAAPIGVIHGVSAAEVWSDQPLSSPVQVSHPTLRSRAGVRVSRHRIPLNFIIEHRDIRLAEPGFVAAEIAATDHGRLLSELLRSGLATQAGVQAALTNFTDCPGQLARRRALRNCERNPWSYAEVRLHNILREAHITGWTANAKIRIASQVCHPDVLFDEDLIVVEFDGRAAHSSAKQFLRDRERQNLLVLAGYRVLRFTWEHLDDPSYIVTAVRRARNEAPSHRRLRA